MLRAGDDAGALPLVDAERMSTMRRSESALTSSGVYRRDPRAGLGEHVVYPRNCGSTFSPKSRICSWRSAPHSSSITCVQPASRYSSIASMQSDGVPAIGRHLSRSASRDLRLRGETSAVLHRVGDGPDLVLLDPGELEQRVGRALDVLHLVREVHAGDLARAVAARVAVGRVDRGDDGAADVDLAADVLARVADERRRRDRRREAAVARSRRRAAASSARSPRRRPAAPRAARARRPPAPARRRSTCRRRSRTARRRGRRARSSPRRASARASSSSASSCC